MCAASLQESKECNDFEVRFCCPNSKNAVINKTQKLVIGNSRCGTDDLKDLNINDIRKLNR